MFNRLIIILFFTITLPFILKAEWIPLNKNVESNTPPQVTLISDDNNSTVIKVDISGFQLNEFTANGKTYHSIDLLSEISTTKVGYPEVPYISKVLAIPNQTGVSVEVVETSEIITLSNIDLQPARESWIEGESETEYLPNLEAYQSTKIFPNENASVEKPSIFRVFRIASISILPIRYLAAKKQIQTVSSITIRVNYGDGEVINPKRSAQKPIAPSFDKLYRSFIFNYQNVLESRFNEDADGYDLMLCIMPDNFVSTFQSYANWKNSSGTKIHITKFSDIGASAYNPDIIKNYISTVYHNWAYPPSYVLIIGDDGYFPTKTVSFSYTSYSFQNEDYFVAVDGNDHFPEMMIGRISNQTTYRLETILNKSLNYEKNPYVADTDWFKKGICCSNDAYPSQVKTKRFTAEVMLQDGGFTSVDTLMSNTPCPANTQDIINIINEGRSFLNYRGEGWYSGWHASCYWFDTGDVSNLNNGEKLTFFTSIGCGVSNFKYSSGSSFGERLVKLGTPTAPRGACAFVGPVSNTHTTYNNKIDKGIYVGMFREDMDTPGQALLRGKLYLYNVYGSDQWVDYHYKVFCILGDPSLHIWKDVPKAVNVTHPSNFHVGFSQVEIIVSDSASSIPVENAQVSLVSDSVFATGFTDASGKVIISVSSNNEDTLSVTVRGGNVIPYTGSIIINQENEYISFNDEPTIIDLNGNSDGLLNPNETGEITFSLKNWGLHTSNNVQATLSVLETNYIQILTTTPVSYGNIDPDSSVIGTPFQFYIEENTPVGHIPVFILNITSSTDSWNYTYKAEIRGCELMITDFRVDDKNTLNHNYRMDPGESVKLHLIINNLGDDIAPDVSGILRSNDPYITIIDSMGGFSTLQPDSNAMNEIDYFVVSVDSACPIEYVADYSVEFNTNNGNYPYVSIDSLSIAVAAPMGIDPTGPDNYGYYAYASDDTIFADYIEYDWIEIDTLGLGTLIPQPVNTSDFTQTVSLPFAFKYYGTNYNQVRISSDGWIAFGSGTQIAYENFPLPHNDDVNCMVAAFWDDLYSRSADETGRLLYYYDSLNDQFIIEWNGVGHFSDFSDRETFQIILQPPPAEPPLTDDGIIIFQYKTVSEEISSTVGIENHLQDDGIQYVFNDAYDITATRLRSNLAIKFTTNPPQITTGVNDEYDTENASLPKNFQLEQNYPNPFNPETRIAYSIPLKCNVKLAIYNINGQLVKSLQNGEQIAGYYTKIWNGKNNRGEMVSSGVYFYRIQTDNFVQSKKLILLR